MSDFFVQAVTRAGVTAGVLMIVAAAAWVLLTKLGYMRSGVPLNAGDMRTWPLSFVLIDAASFGVTYAGVAALLSASDFATPVAAGLAAIVAIGLVPWLAARRANPD